MARKRGSESETARVISEVRSSARSACDDPSTTSILFIVSATEAQGAAILLAKSLRIGIRTTRSHRPAQRGEIESLEICQASTGFSCASSDSGVGADCVRYVR